MGVGHVVAFGMQTSLQSSARSDGALFRDSFSGRCSGEKPADGSGNRVPATGFGGSGSRPGASTVSGYSSNGYSRRCPPGDAKSTDRRRLLADRNAYIAYLEAQVERANEAALQAEEVGASLRQVRARVDDLEKQVTNRNHLTAHRSAALPRASGNDNDATLLPSRVRELEVAIAECRVNAEAENTRLRNEVSLAVQELGQSLDERGKQLQQRLESTVIELQGLAAVTGGGAAESAAASVAAREAIHEAQATCARLADDALAAAEASQRKVQDIADQNEACRRRIDDLERGTETGFETLRSEMNASTAAAGAAATASAAAWVPHRSVGSNFDFAMLRQDAGRDRAEHDLSPNRTDAYPSVPLSEAAIESVAETLEKRLASRLGQQVLRLSDVLRRVVQAQIALHQQVTVSWTVPTSRSPVLAAAESQTRTSATTTPQASQRLHRLSQSRDSWPCDMAGPPRPCQVASRNTAIDELYSELRRLEEECGGGGNGQRKGTQHQIAQMCSSKSGPAHSFGKSPGRVLRGGCTGQGPPHR